MATPGLCHGNARKISAAFKTPLMNLLHTLRNVNLSDGTVTERIGTNCLQ